MAGELLSAAIVLWRFRFELNESRAAKSTGILLFVLAGLVLLTPIWNLLGHREARLSFLGIGILQGAAMVMPWLARQKRRRLASIASSAALQADGIN